MEKGDKIVVYGTLRKGRSANGTMQKGARFLRTTHINGEMYNIGWFPGLKGARPEDQPFEEDNGLGVVECDLYEIEDGVLPKILDGYEGYPSLYDRQKVKTQCGETAWVYTYNGAVSEDSKVTSGIWE